MFETTGSTSSILEIYGGATEVAKRIISAASKVEGSGISADQNVDAFLEQLSGITSEELGRYLAVNGINLSDIFPDSETNSELEISVGVGCDGTFASDKLLDVTFSKMGALNAICSPK